MFIEQISHVFILVSWAFTLDLSYEGHFSPVFTTVLFKKADLNWGKTGCSALDQGIFGVLKSIRIIQILKKLLKDLHQLG